MKYNQDALQVQLVGDAAEGDDDGALRRDDGAPVERDSTSRSQARRRRLRRQLLLIGAACGTPPGLASTSVSSDECISDVPEEVKPEDNDESMNADDHVSREPPHAYMALRAMQAPAWNFDPEEYFEPEEFDPEEPDPEDNNAEPNTDLQVGDVVSVMGFTSAAGQELSHSVATLVKFDSSRDRWQVRVLGTEETTLIKPENLIRLDGPVPEQQQHLCDAVRAHLAAHGLDRMAADFARQYLLPPFIVRALLKGLAAADDIATALRIAAETATETNVWSNEERFADISRFLDDLYWSMTTDASMTTSSGDPERSGGHR